MLFPNRDDWERHFGKRPRWQPDKVDAVATRLLRYLEWSRAGEPADLFQEVVKRFMAKVAEHPELLELDDPSAYLNGIARHVAQEARKKRKQQCLPLIGDQPANVGAFRRLNQTEMAILLREIRHLLTRQEWELLRLAAVGDTETWRIREGLTPGALRVRLHRIRQKLEQRGLGDSPPPGGARGI